MATTKPAPTLTIATTKGQREIPAIWRGRNIAVHARFANGTLSPLRGQYGITHLATGYSCGAFQCSKARVLKLARLWDARFGDLTVAGAERSWRYRYTYTADVRRVLDGEAPEGPVLPDHPTSGDVAAAISSAIGGNYAPAAPDDAAAQYPAHETVAASLLRTGADGAELLWRGRWWPVPTLGEVEAWCLDSVAETPDGRTVEPDAPDAWPRLLGVM